MPLHVISLKLRRTILACLYTAAAFSLAISPGNSLEQIPKVKLEAIESRFFHKTFRLIH